MIYLVVISINKKILGMILSIIIVTAIFPSVQSIAQTHNEQIYNKQKIQNNKLFQNNIFHLLKERFDILKTQHEPMDSALPDSFSWRNIEGKDYSTPVKSQGQVPSCWAFGAIAAIESSIEIRENCPDLNPDLSEQFLLSCIPKIREENNVRPFYWIMNSSAEGYDCNGVISESCFPYEYSLDVSCSKKSSDWNSHIIPILNFSYWIPDGSPKENDDIIKRKIMETGPVTAKIDVSFLADTWGDFCHNPKAYFPNIPSIPRLMGKRTGLHLITLIGWHDTALIASGGYWICKNSWGTDWGYGGYFNLAYGALGVGRVIFPIDDEYIPYIGTVDYDPDSYDWPPIAKPGGPYTGSINEDIIFDASNSIDAEKEIISYTWDLGDGYTESGMKCLHQYMDDGEFEVMLTVIDGGGNQDSAMTSVLIE